MYVDVQNMANFTAVSVLVALTDSFTLLSATPLLLLLLLLLLSLLSLLSLNQELH